MSILKSIVILSKEKSLKIIEKMDENACEIKKENSKETGFLCIISVPHEKKPLPVLITCNHILGEKDLKKGDKIIIEINNNEKILKIKNQRKIYIDKKNNDITIIELLPEDELDINNMLEIEDDIFNSEMLNNISSYIKNKESNFNMLKKRNILLDIQILYQKRQH